MTTPKFESRVSTTRGRVTILLSCLATLLVLALSLWPSKQPLSKTYSWNPVLDTVPVEPIHGPSTAVGRRFAVLGSIEQVQIRIKLKRNEVIEGETVVFTNLLGGITIKMSDQRTTLICESTQEKLESDRKNRHSVTWRVDGSVALDRKNLKSSCDAPSGGVFTSLGFLRQAGKVTADLTLISNTTRVGVFRWAMVLVFTIVLILWAAFSARTKKNRGERKRLTVRFRLFISTSALGAVAALLGPSYYDDGWVQASTESWRVGGTFLNYFEKLGAFNPLGALHDAVFLPFTFGEFNLIVWRAPTVACIVVSFLLSRSCLARLTSDKPSAQAVMAHDVFFAIGTVSWLVTLRPEPVVVMLSGCCLYLGLNILDEGTWGKLPLMAVIAGIALSLHHTGLVAMVPVLILPILKLPRPRVAGDKVVANASWRAAFGFFAVFSILTFGPVGIQRWFQNNKLVETDVHSLGWRDELKRYNEVFSQFFMTPSRRLSVLLLLLIVGVVLYFFRSENDLKTRFAYLSLILGLLSFALFPSKWAWHFGSLTLIGALAVGKLADRLSKEIARKKRSSLAGVLIILIIVALSIAVNAPDRIWGPLSWNLATQRWSELSNEIVGSTAFLAFGGVLAFAAILRTRQFAKHAFLLTLAVTALVGPGGFVVEGVSGLLIPGWTEQKTATLQVPKCDMKNWYVADPSKGGLSPIKTNLAQRFAASQNMGEAIRESHGEYSAGIPSYVGSSFYSSGRQRGWLNLGSYFYKGETEVVGLPIRSKDGRRIRVWVLTFRGSGGIKSSIIEVTFRRSMSDWHWVNLSDAAELSQGPFALIVEDRSSALGDDVEVGVPHYWSKEQVLDDVAFGRTIYLSPWIRPYLPCMKLPEVASGVEPPADFYLGDVTSVEGLGGTRHRAGIEMQRLNLWSFSSQRIISLPLYRYHETYLRSNPIVEVP